MEPLTDLFLNDKNVFNAIDLHVLKSSSVKISENAPFSLFVSISDGINIKSR